MNSNLVSKRRLLTRIIAFLSIVCFDIHNSIDSTVKSNRRAAEAEADLHLHASFQNNNHIHTINNNISSNYSHNDTIRISFQLHDPTDVPFKDLFAPSHGCKLGKMAPPAGGGIRTGEIPPSLLIGGGLSGIEHDNHYPDLQSAAGRVLDFTTTISSNLKILHIGDSVTLQIAEALDEMMGAQELQSRRQLWEAWKGADGGTLVAPTWGGGMNGAWRITGLLSNAGRVSKTHHHVICHVCFC